jgi:hypothetical protein
VHFALVVLEQFTKDLGCGDELRRREFLPADHQHVMLGKGAVQRRAGFGVDSLVEVNAGTSAPVCGVNCVIVYSVILAARFRAEVEENSPMEGALAAGG